MKTGLNSNPNFKPVKWSQELPKNDAPQIGSKIESIPKDNSFQFHFIYIAPNHNHGYLNVLFIAR